MPRFFVKDDKINKEEKIITVTGDDARHIARSLRMAVGDSLTVSDGEGTDYECTLTRIRDEECLLSYTECVRGSAEPPVKITLYMAYPKGDKLETVVQKAVELGVSSVVPFISERCIKRPSADKKDNKTDRLERIAHEAAKQCGRSALPTVGTPITFTELVGRIKDHDLTLFCYEGRDAVSLKSVLEGAGDEKSIAVIVGSEGGFSEREALECKNAGAMTVNLGPRILRCETAPDYCLSAISYVFEL